MPTHQAPEVPWYKVPLLWLGLAIFVGSLAACGHMIYLSQSFTATEVDAHQGSSFKGVPLQAQKPEASE